MASDIVMKNDLPTYQGQCSLRRDDSGFKNAFKAWHIFLVHLAGCVVFIVFLTLIDGRNFLIGSQSVSRRNGWRLYQADISGLVSLYVTIIRILAGVGSTLLIWRSISILLSKGQITLGELCDMVGKKILLRSPFQSWSEFVWSAFAIAVLVLIWPTSLASPLANSSLTWHPVKESVKDLKTTYNINLVETNKRFPQFQYEHLIQAVTLRAISTGSIDPDYSFVTGETALRRYVLLEPPMPEGATGNMALPFFNVTSITWFDSPATTYPGPPDVANIGNASMLKSPPDTWGAGTIGFWMSKKWENQDTKGYTPTIFEGKRNISVFVGSLWDDKPTNDGTLPNINTSCPSMTPDFGALPDVKQYRVNVFVAETWRRTDCYMLAEVGMKAGRYLQHSVDINLLGPSTGTHIANATLGSISDGAPSLQPDWAIMPTLDMMTDVMRQIYQLNATSRYQKNNLNGFIRGTLKLAYDSTWSALPLIIDDSQETISAVPSQSVIRTEVNKARLFAWLAMNVTLQFAAIIVAIVHHFATPKLKMTRDPTLMALNMDLGDVKHENGDGLCNAVGLEKPDKELGRMKWGDGPAAVTGADAGGGVSPYCRKVVLVHGRERERSALHPLH
ncbi:hypothetical protein BCR34DRAFT_578875 [Clohesyomyces aquaticus]|uniref:Uncharacterized protein n=1 Tax=Clohesyomyces aquaticus TaxID=1231657 RepID=A0A1Y1YDF4_9PLEO|nr:hypothetical protein BCR34DRAFT_578875 [Clohesyomyces aquaticus]